ncbi:MAG: hypothetical protein JO020_14925 [Chloroflexi bacterium]|nr:hypothetical protein [Chloroflexota bacterium]MBV9131810.1 hypothetical protein [Chloroflexota bacterium]MBV9895454.1 hypothetical protein [Chloroflexota bacterium]
MPQQFTIRLDGQTRSLSRLLQRLAAHHVGVRAFAVAEIDDTSTVVVMTSDDSATQSILREHKYPYVSSEVVVTSVPDKEFALANLFAQIGHAGISLHGLSLLRWHQGKAELALSGDNPAALQQVLSACQVDRLMEPVN